MWIFSKSGIQFTKSSWCLEDSGIILSSFPIRRFDKLANLRSVKKWKMSVFAEFSDQGQGHWFSTQMRKKVFLKRRVLQSWNSKFLRHIPDNNAHFLHWIITSVLIDKNGKSHSSFSLPKFSLMLLSSVCTCQSVVSVMPGVATPSPAKDDWEMMVKSSSKTLMHVWVDHPGVACFCCEQCLLRFIQAMLSSM